MQRVADLAQKHERRSRRDLVVATGEHERAEAALRSVFLQCREVVEQHDGFSIRFGRSLIEAGWLSEQQRRTERDAAAIAVETKRSAWQQQRTRLDALGRLVDRLADADADAVEREVERELDDLINTRTTRLSKEVPA
jgi:flagellar biosynthesis chaperone FliJ